MVTLKEALAVVDLLRILAGLVLVVVLVVGGAYLAWSSDIGAEMNRLRAEAKPPNSAVITAEQVAALPPPATRYFGRAGVIGTTIPHLVRLTQTGRIRSSVDSGWMPLEAEEIYSTNPPAFVWRAGMPSLALPVALGRDLYLGGEGSIRMKLAALFPVADEGGEALRAAGLMRYLNEMMWFPAAYLGGNVTIFAVDDTAFGVRIADRGLTAEAILFIDAVGRPTNFRATRYNTGTRSMETWETPIATWGPRAGLELPTAGAADWKLADGDLRYIEIEIKSVTYEP